MRVTRIALLTASVIAAGAAGCGSDDNSTSGAPSSTAAAQGPSDGGYAEARAYVGGTAGKADPAKTPVTIGFVNQEGAVPGWTETVPAAKAAAQVVNTRLGGIEGRPLEVKYCTIVSSEEDGQKCGQQMANDASVKTIVLGAGVVGKASLYKALQGRKAVISEPNTPPDLGSPSVYNITGGAFAVLPAMAIFTARSLKAKNVSFIYSDDVGGKATVKAATPVFEALGAKITSATVSESSADAIGPVTASKAPSADAIFVSSPAPVCVQVAKALKQLQVRAPVVTTTLCADASVKKALGDLPAWYYGQESTIYAKRGGSPSTDEYAAAMFETNGPDANLQGFATGAFSKVLTVAKLFNEIGADATPKQFEAAVETFKGPVFNGPPKLDCGAIPSAPAICAPYGRMYKYNGDDTYVPAGGWIDISAKG